MHENKIKSIVIEGYKKKAVDMTEKDFEDENYIYFRDKLIEDNLEIYKKLCEEAQKELLDKIERELKATTYHGKTSGEDVFQDIIQNISKE
jgi:hypothetical protein